MKLNLRLQMVFFTLITSALVASPLHADKDDDDRYESRRSYGGMGMGGHYGGMGMMGGPGMGSMHRPIQMLDLSDSQRKKINVLHDASRKKSWEVMGKVMDEGAKLRDLYAEDRLNASKISTSYDRIFSLQKKMIQSRITVHNQQYDLLNNKQRKKLKKLRSQRGGYGMGHHGRGGMMGR